MQWIIFRRLEEAIAHREAGKYPISSDILDKTIDELKEINTIEKVKNQHVSQKRHPQKSINTDTSPMKKTAS